MLETLARIYTDFRYDPEHGLRDVDMDVLEHVFRQVYLRPGVVPYNREAWDAGRAPREHVKRDLVVARDPLYYSSGGEFDRFLELRASEGRGQAGHGGYRRIEQRDGRMVRLADPRPNHTLRDVTRVADTSLAELQRRTDEEIARVLEPLEEWFSDPYDLTIILPSRPYFDIPELAGLELNALPFLRGFYFAGGMDSGRFRGMVNETYKHQMGWGETHAVDIERLRDANISLEDWAEMRFRNAILWGMTHDQRLELGRRVGFLRPLAPNDDAGSVEEILARGEHAGERDGSYVASLYARRHRGKGLSDDTARVLAAFLPPYGRSERGDHRLDWLAGFLGASAADYLDTLAPSASIIVANGLDEAVAQLYDRRFQELVRDRKFLAVHGLPYSPEHIVSDTEMRDFVAASANRRDIIHSSERYFRRRQQLNPETMPTCTLRELLFLAQDEATRHDQDAAPYFRRSPGEGCPNWPRVGFGRQPWNAVRAEIGERISLVASPLDRTGRVMEYFSRRRQVA